MGQGGRFRPPDLASVCAMIVDHLDLSTSEFAAGTGWAIKPEGACKGDVCVPLDGDSFDPLATFEKLGMAVVHDPETGVWAIGPETLGGRALVSAEAPELGLPTLHGEEFRLSSHRGEKVAIVAWAPY